MYRWRGLGDVSGVQSLIETTAARYGVPASLALAVAQRESHFDQAARGAKGEIGVFQLMPGTAAGLGVNAYDLQQNVEGGVRYLSQLYRRFGNWLQALQGYNGGPGNVSKGTVSNAAQQYAAAVLAASGVPAGPTVETGEGGHLGEWPEGEGEGDWWPEDETGVAASLSPAAKWAIGLSAGAVALLLLTD